MITQDLIRSLLWEEETSSLDFKRDQYPFVGATDDQKSELLKDLLAFANAFRRSDAYILVGVKEVKGWQSEIIGISTDIDDSQFQQFVNGKTNRILEFSYRAMDLDGEKIGIFHIPLQQRPVFLKKDYGKLKKNEVYYRLGTSTMTASPDVIAAMGTSSVKAQPVYEPLLSVTFEDRSNSLDVQIPEFTRFTEDDVLQRVEEFKKQYPCETYYARDSSGRMGFPLNLVSKFLEDEKSIMSLPSEEEVKEYNGYLHEHYSKYEDYTRKKFEYSGQAVGRVDIQLLIKNQGTLPAEDIDVWFHFPDGMKVLNSWQQNFEPKEPKPPESIWMYRKFRGLSSMSDLDYRSLMFLPSSDSGPPPNVSGFNIRETNSVEVDVHVQMLKHHNSEILDDFVVLFDSVESVQPFEIEYRLIAANVPHPVEGVLTVNAEIIP